MGGRRKKSIDKKAIDNSLAELINDAWSLKKELRNSGISMYCVFTGVYKQNHKEAAVPSVELEYSMRDGRWRGYFIFSYNLNLFHMWKKGW